MSAIDRSLQVRGSEALSAAQIRTPQQRQLTQMLDPGQPPVWSGTTFSLDSTGKQANNNPETEACAVKPLNSVADLKLNLISLCLKEKPQDVPAPASAQHRREGCSEQACPHSKGREGCHCVCCGRSPLWGTSLEIKHPKIIHY